MTSTRAYLLGTASTIALTGAAFGADLPVKAIAPAPVVMNWTGPYVGIDLGMVRHRATSEDITPGIGPGFSGTLTRTGVTFGGHAGYNWQFSSIVLGLEGDISSMGGSSSITFGPPGINPPPETFTSELKWMASARGRVGVAFDALLLYGTAGVAVGRIANSRVDPLLFVNVSEDKTKTAPIWGGGAEYRFHPNWTARIEALHVNFGSSTIDTTPFPGLTYRTRFSNQATIVRGGLSLRW
jgi:outer membrane immunogenic protein